MQKKKEEQKSKTEYLAVNTIRMLGVCAIEKANSGHPGIVLSAAPMMYELFVNHLNYSPEYPIYFNRDRFILSAGHASALLYATQLVCGYKTLTMEDLKNFRQINSKTPGHPENTVLESIEVSTGPLGQGIAMAVGMAIAEQKLANELNVYNKLINHYTYCLFGDGDLEEGVSTEAISMAGHLKLNKLIMLYDSNDVQLDGRVTDSTSLDVKKYFLSHGWKYLIVKDGNNLKEIKFALQKAKLSTKPTMIEVKTRIGYGCDLENTNLVHGSPLNKEQIEKLKKNLNYDYDDFLIPAVVKKMTNKITKKVERKINRFNTNLTNLERLDLDLYNLALKIVNNQASTFDYSWYDTEVFSSKDATRNICGKALQPIALNNPMLLVGSADLSSSTKVKVENSPAIASSNFNGQNINYGVREFAMAAINNGIVAHGGCRAVGSTFLSFSDYCKAAIRLAAINHFPTINIFSHDSITVGEDGPTHQPIEQIWSLRLIPNHTVFRPCSTSDMLVAWEYAMNSKKTPTTIITSRSAFQQINVSKTIAVKGAYVIYNSKTKHDLTIYATGSEVDVAIEVAKKIEKKLVRVVAINSFELFKQQSDDYKKTIFDKKKKISIEFGSTTPWYKYVDYAVGIDEFGHSGKPNDVIAKMELTVTEITKKIQNFIK